ncbi:aminotransferase class V-fold PLP-dependent enzyme [Actinopolymorpha sp. B17G11]|uniref:aminotransferase class V-fold PLP-dependent enzyme n=1 Tax=Actinopolymorpha sp. B17G11 TaxID=3160861 RepID=UPI0032E3F5B5
MTADVAAEGSNELWGPDWPGVRESWSLDPHRAHLNHGSFGAVPGPVREAQDRWRDLMDANPMRYFRTIRTPSIVAARQAGASLLQTSPEAVALVANATAGVSTVLAGLGLRAGDEIVLTDHGYGAVALAAKRFARAAGARVVSVKIALTASDEEVVQRLAEAVGPRTRLVLVDQVTSPTARAFPVGGIAEMARSHDVPTLVDGAHAPGMLDVRLDSLGVDFWVGNFHKWAFAARSVAALWVAPRWRESIRPLVISWNDEQGYPTSFDQQGTTDDSAWLSLPDAVRFFEDLGVDRVRRHNSTLVAYAQETLATALGVSLADVSSDPRMSMRLVPLPRGVAATEEQAARLYASIADKIGAEVAVVSWSGRGWIRLSAQVYNAPAEYDRLAVGLSDLIR